MQTLAPLSRRSSARRGHRGELKRMPFTSPPIPAHRSVPLSAGILTGLPAVPAEGSSHLADLQSPDARDSLEKGTGVERPPSPHSQGPRAPHTAIRLGRHRPEAPLFSLMLLPLVLLMGMDVKDAWMTAVLQHALLKGGGRSKQGLG